MYGLVDRGGKEKKNKRMANLLARSPELHILKELQAYISSSCLPISPYNSNDPHITFMQ